MAPNGFHGSKEEWERMVAPLRQFDAALQEFAAGLGATVAANYHNMPNRMLSWTTGGIRRQIEIILYGEEPLVQCSWAAYQDRARERRGKSGLVISGLPTTRLRAELPSMLEQARAEVEAVLEEDLEFWTAIR